MTLLALRLPRATIVLALAAAACTNATAPTGGGAGGSDTLIAAPSFANDIQPIFSASCSRSSCHGATASRQNAYLDLRPNTAYDQLVNVLGDQEPIIRVIPGNANGSYLVIKLEGRQRVGSKMPKGAPPLDAVRLENIRTWISQGAQNN